MGRVGTPDDLAGALLFLAGRAGAYTTGAVLPLDGGLHCAAAPAMFGH
jgi:NAD(P)-dependent dehydrogenase (short-subunit alcohol dehydrogenase family)